MILAAATIAVLVALTLGVIRALRGPTVFDRVLAANAIGTGAIAIEQERGRAIQRRIFCVEQGHGHFFTIMSWSHDAARHIL